MRYSISTDGEFVSEKMQNKIAWYQKQSDRYGRSIFKKISNKPMQREMKPVIDSMY